MAVAHRTARKTFTSMSERRENMQTFFVIHFFQPRPLRLFLVSNGRVGSCPSLPLPTQSLAGLKGAKSKPLREGLLINGEGLFSSVPIPVNHKIRKSGFILVGKLAVKPIT